MNVDCSPPQTNARMLDKLVGEFIESTCILRCVELVTRRELFTAGLLQSRHHLHSPPGSLPVDDEFLKRVLKKMNVDCSPPQTNARMLDKLVGEFIEWSWSPGGNFSPQASSKAGIISTRRQGAFQLTL
jgi:hypothetical protein